MLTSLSEIEQQAFFRLIMFFDYQISPITDQQDKTLFLTDYGLGDNIDLYRELDELPEKSDLTQEQREECYRLMDVIRLLVKAHAALHLIPCIYANYLPEELPGELRKVIELSVEPLDWLSVTLQSHRLPDADTTAFYRIYERAGIDGRIQLSLSEEQIPLVMSVRQMVSNLSVGYDEFHHLTNGENTDFSRLPYSPDESYTRLHETHILIRSFQMYCSAGLDCMEVLLKGHHVLLLKSVLYKEVLKPDLSGLTAPVTDCFLLMAQTIYLYTVRRQPDGHTTGAVLLSRMSEHLEGLGVDTYRIDVMAESFSEEYIQYFREVGSGSRMLSDIPGEFVDGMMVQEALRCSMLNFQFVPADFQTPEMCLAAVRVDGLALRYVSNDYRSADVCDEALLNNGLAIRYFPEGLVNREAALSAVERNYNAYFILPPEYQVKETLLAAVRQNPAIYERLSESDRGVAAVALLAISSHPLLAALLPGALAMNREFLDLADRIKNGWHFFVQEKYKTEYGNQLRG